MESEVKEIHKEIISLSGRLKDISQSIEEMSRKLEYLYKEVGTREGRNLYQQIDEIERRSQDMDRNLTEVTRDTKTARRLIEFGDVKLKEIMKALAYIYRNTDELESNLVDAENLKTTG